MLIEIIYGSLCAMALFASLMVIFSRDAVYSALFLILTMTSIAGLFVLMNAPLAAALQIIVYAGAIMVLFLFVIMLLNVAKQHTPPTRLGYTRRVGLLLGLAFVIQVAAMIGQLGPPAGYSLADAESIEISRVAHLLVTDYIYAFEMTSVLLLVAVIGAIVLARRHLVQGTEVRPEADGG